MKRYLDNEGVFNNFRKIDIDMIIDFHLYNLVFTKNDMKLPDEKACVLLNLLWSVLRQGDPRYTERSEGEKKNEKELRDFKKTREEDMNLLKALLQSHSID